MKKTVSILIILTMLVSLVPAYSLTVTAEVTEAPLYGTEEMIEFEDGYILGAYVNVVSGSSASGGTALALGGSRTENVPADVLPDVSFKINIPTEGTYYIYMRYHSSSSGTDSFHYIWDRESAGGNYIYAGTAITDGVWGWKAIKSPNLTAGVHTLDFMRREAGIIVDAFIVTTDYEEIDIEAEEERIVNEGAAMQSPQFALDSTATTFNATNGHLIVEMESLVEDMDYDSSIYQVVDDSAAAGGKALKAIGGTGSGGDAPDVGAKGLEFNFISDVTVPAYNIWIRVKVPGGGADSSYMSVDGSNNNGKYLGAGGFGETEIVEKEYIYEWRKAGAVSNVFKASKHNVRFYPREYNHLIDKIVLTSDTLRSPAGIDGEMEDVVLSATKYPAPTITPPPEHPRLYFTAADIPAIKENMQKEQNQLAVERYESYLEQYDTSFDGKFGNLLLESYTNYNSAILATIEAFAFKYAIDGDENYGRRAIDCLINMLNTASWDPNGQDVTRPMGHVIFLASQVYDWCYPLLTEDEKNYIIARCEWTASMMEVGYPPSGQGAVCGHGGEAQLFRDLLGLGIATYDERPDIYNFVAGRLLSEFVITRNYWYESATHHQGSGYGSYRFFWEMLFQEIMYRMTGGDTNGGVRVFNDTMANVPYFFIYTRRGDGQVFRTGDATGESSALGTYSSAFIDTMFYSANFYGDAILKGEYDIENPAGNFNNGNGTRTPVEHILFNDPDLVGNQDKNSLPLSYYFGSPNGMMIARTGWDVNPKNPAEVDDVVAMMKIGERWGSNHHHLDSGNFQLYYKGILASESGYYELYGTLHDQNYNKASIAHNIITVYNPNERLGSTKNNFTDRNGDTVNLTSIFPNGVNDGGQRRPGGEPSTWEIWNGDTGINYDTGVVLDHAFGPDKMTPEYTYIKGDITEAYSSEAAGSAEVDRKVEKVIRSMAFMPLDDENYPAIMVVMDKVTSTNPEFKKKWLLHMQLEPEVDEENGVSIIKNDQNGNNGKLTVQTLLPKNAEITKVGGEGKRYWIGRQDANSNFDTDGYNFDTIDEIPLGGGIEAGWGRIEVSPPAASKTDKFLNVLAVSDADNEAKPLDSELIEGSGLVGVKTADKVLMFSDVDTSNADKNRVLDRASFTVPGEDETLDVMIAGVKSGMWEITNGNTKKIANADEEGGTLYFEGGAGEYTIEHISSRVYDVTITGVSAQKNGDTYDVEVSLDGDATGAKVIVAIYDELQRIVDIKSTAATESGVCNIPFDADDVKNAYEVRVFVWEGFATMEPLSMVRTVSASKVFK